MSELTRYRVHLVLLVLIGVSVGFLLSPILRGSAPPLAWLQVVLNGVVIASLLASLWKGPRSGEQRARNSAWGTKLLLVALGFAAVLVVSRFVALR